MDKLIIKGGRPLEGEISISGAKNAALPILAATLLADAPVNISNVPHLHDITTTIGLLARMGSKLTIDERMNLEVDSTDIKDFSAPYELVKTMRSSIIVLGPLLAKYGKADVSLPGGCAIGSRPVNIHLQGLRSMGADIRVERGYIRATAKRLKGVHLTMDIVTVTGTEKLMMAATLAEGKTVLENDAREPEVFDLANCLISMGAKIEGIGSNRISITGVKLLNGCTHTVLPDMIEIGSWIGLAAITKSDITIKNVSWKNLGLIPRVFKKLGIKINKVNYDIHIPAQENYSIQSFIDGSILTISDAPWPGFTPDLLSIILVVATQAKGSLLIHQKMFESRLFFVDKLIDMGAKVILCDPHRATVIGMNHESQLKATTMTSPDIRAGISLLIAALSADGISIIHNIEQIDRGYEDIDVRLRAIGAKITRIN